MSEEENNNTEGESQEETLEKLGEAIEEEVAEKKVETLGDKKRKRPVAVLLESPQVLKQLASVKLQGVDFKKRGKVGLEKTGKTVIIFYEQASRAGDRFRGLVFLLLGLSVALTGVFATGENLFSLKVLIVALMGNFIGRLIVAAIGLSLMAYGSSKLFHGITDLGLFKKKGPKPKYIQKKLVSPGAKKKSKL